MLKLLGRSIAVLTFVGLASSPASAQPNVRVEFPLPGLEIHVAHTSPPHSRSETKPHSPGHGYVWLRGSWHWQENDWVWVPGRWERPDQHGSHWVKARYVHEGHAWRYEPAHWSHQSLYEGDDYKHWKSENGHHHDGNHDHGHDGDHDHH